jgi:preprotein translocase subunit SecD
MYNLGGMYKYPALGVVFILAGFIFPGLVNLIPLLLIFYSIYLPLFVAKKDDEKVKVLGILVILSLLSFMHGIKLGIEFSGGSRLIFQSDEPIVDMVGLIQKIKSRLSGVGLEQINVKGIGENLIYIETPGSLNEESLNRISNIVSRKGKFIAIVDGEIVYTGEDILPGSVGVITDRARLGGADWGVVFSLTPDANNKFIEKIRGKANYPLYMFLDPIENQNINVNVSGLSDAEIQKLLEVLSYLNVTISENGTEVKNDFKFINTIEGPLLSSWKSIGLISAPTLNPSLTRSSVSISYLITGTGDIKEANLISSVLRGGDIPYKLELIGVTNIPPALGELTLFYTIAGLIITVALISLYIALRYKNKNIILATLIVSISEILILLAIVGRFGLDLAAMVGLIAALGVSIDAQIIINDNLNKKTDPKQIFYIIRNNFFIAVLVLLPLFFLSAPEIVGFSLVAIFAYILGYLVSRTSYYTLVSRNLFNTYK